MHCTDRVNEETEVEGAGRMGRHRTDFLLPHTYPRMNLLGCLMTCCLESHILAICVSLLPMVPATWRLTGSKSVFFVVAAVAFSRSYCTHTFSSSCSFTKLIPGLSTAFDLTLLKMAVLHKLPHKTSCYEQKLWEIHLETSIWKVHMSHQCPRISFKLWRILDWQVSPDRATYT